MSSNKDNDKKEILDKLKDNGLLNDSVKDELYDLIVENDKKELEKAKDKFNKCFEELRMMGKLDLL